jgi:hypothetical protein
MKGDSCENLDAPRHQPMTSLEHFSITTDRPDSSNSSILSYFASVIKQTEDYDHQTQIPVDASGRLRIA